MNKLLSTLLALCLILTLAACGENTDSSSTPSGNGNYPENNTASSTPKGESIASLPDFLPETFVLGVNPSVWSTKLTLKKDGSFTGKYTEYSTEADADAGYPNGTVLICEFSGSFDSFIKINDLTYAMKLAELTPEYGPNEAWIENGVLYSTAHPVGISDGEWFYIYLPGTPTAGLDKSCTMWLLDLPETLDAYGLYNPNARYAFFAE